MKTKVRTVMANPIRFPSRLFGQRCIPMMSEITLWFTYVKVISLNWFCIFRMIRARLGRTTKEMWSASEIITSQVPMYERNPILKAFTRRKTGRA